MGLKSWIAEKAKTKQAKNIADASAQALFALKEALRLMAEYRPSDDALSSELVTKTQGDQARRIASFCMGPMNAAQAWADVFQGMIETNEAVLTPKVAGAMNDILRDAYRIAVEQNLLRSE